MAIFFDHASNSRLSNLSSLISIFRSSSQLVTSGTPRLHGLIEAIDASTSGVSSYIDFGNLGARKLCCHIWFIWFFRQKEIINLANGAFASTSSTQGLNFGKLINKKTKKQLRKGCSKNNELPNFFGLNLC